MNVDLTAAAMVPNIEGAGMPTRTKASSDDKKMAETAKQFEAVMAGEVLKAARGSSQGGWLGLSDGDDQTGEMEVELAEQGLAQGLAANGSLGIAKMVVSNFHRHQPSPMPTETNSGPDSTD
jgi:Rod binding domain-containing protein